MRAESYFASSKLAQEVEGNERPRTKLETVFSIRLCIGMKARQQEIHPPETEDDHQEAEHGIQRRTPAFPASCHPCVNVRAVDQPHDQGPRFFRVPAPIAAPGVICPHSPQNDAEGEKRKSNHDGLVAHSWIGCKFGKAEDNSDLVAALPGLSLKILNDSRPAVIAQAPYAVHLADQVVLR